MFVFDQRSARKEYTSDVLKELLNSANVTSLQNPAGQITDEAAKWLTHFCDGLGEKQLDRPSILLIDGEEDLLTVATVLLAPLGVRLYYGQPHEGMVELHITEAVKEQFYAPFAKS